MRRAVVLLSGGLDSATCLAMAKAQGFEPVCLLVSYGQRHAVELERARRVAEAAGVKDVRVVSLDLRAIGGSALTDDIAVPKDRPAETMAHGIPVTYVPARNTIFLGCGELADAVLPDAGCTCTACTFRYQVAGVRR